MHLNTTARPQPHLEVWPAQHIKGAAGDEGVHGIVRADQRRQARGQFEAALACSRLGRRSSRRRQGCRLWCSRLAAAAGACMLRLLLLLLLLLLRVCVQLG
jgi:ribosomal protein L20